MAVAIASIVMTAAGGRVTTAAADLRYESDVSLPLTLVGAAVVVGSETVLKRRLIPDSCRWCDREADGGDGLNGLDASGRKLQWSSVRRARRISDGLLYVGVPATALGLTYLAARRDNGSRSGEDVGVILEATVISGLLCEIAKFTAGRQRPCAHFGPGCGDIPGEPDRDDNLSFYSGHAAIAFTLATSAGTVASMRGYRWQGAIWATGLTLATATAYLRIAGDRHYLTDVLVGVAVGSAVGIMVPRLLHDGPDDGAPGDAAIAPSIPLVAFSW